jgi:elongation factor 1 alpha-like protein
MSAGTTAVKSELPGGFSHVTDKQIYDALWFYYYDIQKSVDYLVKTYGPKLKAQKKKKAQGRLSPLYEYGAAQHWFRFGVAAGG